MMKGGGDPLDQALGSMSTKDLYRMLQLLDMVEEEKNSEMAMAKRPPKDLSRMFELLQMVDEGPARYDQ